LHKLLEELETLFYSPAHVILLSPSIFCQSGYKTFLQEEEEAEEAEKRERIKRRQKKENNNTITTNKNKSRKKNSFSVNPGRQPCVSMKFQPLPTSAYARCLSFFS